MVANSQRRGALLLPGLALGVVILLALVVMQRRNVSTPIATAEPGLNIEPSAIAPQIELPPVEVQPEVAQLPEQSEQAQPQEQEQAESEVDPADPSTWKSCEVPAPCAVLPADPDAVNPNPLDPDDEVVPWYLPNATPCFGKHPSCR
jgi:hypothetical protein